MSTNPNVLYGMVKIGPAQTQNLTDTQVTLLNGPNGQSFGYVVDQQGEVISKCEGVGLKQTRTNPTAKDESRIKAVLGFIEADVYQPIPQAR